MEWRMLRRRVTSQIGNGRGACGVAKRQAVGANMCCIWGAPKNAPSRDGRIFLGVTRACLTQDFGGTSHPQLQPNLPASQAPATPANLETPSTPVCRSHILPLDTSDAQQPSRTSASDSRHVYFRWCQRTSTVHWELARPLRCSPKLR